MSDKTNADVVHQAYAAFGQGDVPALLSLLTDGYCRRPQCGELVIKIGHHECDLRRSCAVLVMDQLDPPIL